MRLRDAGAHPADEGTRRVDENFTAGSPECQALSPGRGTGASPDSVPVSVVAVLPSVWASRMRGSIFIAVARSSSPPDFDAIAGVASSCTPGPTGLGGRGPHRVSSSKTRMDSNSRQHRLDWELCGSVGMELYGSVGK